MTMQNLRGPFLAVVPLSTVPNWIREFRRWLPQCNALVYVGDATSRKVLPEAMRVQRAVINPSELQRKCIPALAAPVQRPGLRGRRYFTQGAA